MAEDTTHIIMAHGGGQAIFDRHMPVWLSNGYPITVVTPTDSPVSTNHALVRIGTRQHHGTEAIERFVRVISYAVSAGRPRILFDEYDSMAREIPDSVKDKPGFHGFVWRDGDPRNGFAGTFFVHPPLYMDIQSAKDILKAAVRLRSLGYEKHGA